VNGSLFFFVTVYANTDRESISFRFYGEQTDQIYPIADSLVFVSNAILGSPSDPVNLDARCFFSPTSVDPHTESIESMGRLDIYPNPFRDRTTITFTIPSPGTVYSEVFDVRGRVLRRWYMAGAQPGRHVSHLNAGDLSPGLYYYRVRSADLVLSKKLIVLP
jgi:hypothetical protein